MHCSANVNTCKMWQYCQHEWRVYIHTSYDKGRYNALDRLRTLLGIANELPKSAPFVRSTENNDGRTRTDLQSKPKKTHHQIQSVLEEKLQAGNRTTHQLQVPVRPCCLPLDRSVWPQSSVSVSNSNLVRKLIPITFCSQRPWARGERKRSLTEVPLRRGVELERGHRRPPRMESLVRVMYRSHDHAPYPSPCGASTKKRTAHKWSVYELPYTLWTQRGNYLKRFETSIHM